MHASMREFLADLDRAGKLHRVRKSVDRSWEPASLVKWMYQALPDDRRFGLYFERVEGTSIPLVTAALGASTASYALALGVEPDAINETLLAGLRNRVAPRVVTGAPAQEVVMLGEEAHLERLPIPVWTPGKDAGPYISTMVATRSADGGVANMGIYRTQVLDSRKVAVNLSPGRQGTRSVRSHHAANVPAPIAWVIAPEPACYLAAVANLPYGQHEIDFAGGLLGRPIELVQAKTVDLLVPANAEIVIEGEILPDETATEGPFGEFAGYMSSPAERPVARITAITHRRDPIYYGLSSQMPPSESTVLQSLTNAAVVLKVLRDDYGDPNIHDAYVDLMFGGVLAHGIVAMAPQYPGHAKRIGRLVADFFGFKRITIVDPDIDIRDPHHLEWALNARYNPVEDTILIDKVFSPISMDPSLEAKHGVSGSKLIIDATAKRNPGTFSLPPKATMERALASWREAGLPDFEIPKRARLRVDES
jgi:4-hydroxy-3-polyprenylbenzoate decarboxylase